MMRRFIRFAFRTAAVLFLVFLIGFAILWCVCDWSNKGADTYPGGIVLRDRGGNLLRVSLGANDVDCRPYYVADPNDWIVKAIVASEDGTFWTHCGVRPLSIARAGFQNLVFRRRISGASTITMQTVRLINPHPKTFGWKIMEAVLALKLERAHDKTWILSQYLNRAPYGSNLVGIEAGANGWFGKGAKDLGIAEAAILAGMVQAPSRYRPDRSIDRVLKRSKYVLERMEKLGYITESQRKSASEVVPAVCRSARPFKHPYFCDWAMREIEGRGGAKGGDFVTSLDSALQAKCDAVVNDSTCNGAYSAAAVVMKVDTAEILAMACSGDYFSKDAGQVNTALAPRPAGSTLKTFLMAQALDLGLVTPEERLDDVPRVYKGYNPNNFDSKFRGSVTARDSLVLSLNLPFVQLLERVGIDRFAGTLRDLGFKHVPEDASKLGLGMAIGNVDVTLVELVGAYGAIARGGVYKRPVALKDGCGALRTNVFSNASSYLVADMLGGDERSSAALGHITDVEVSRFAWKTGTSSAYRDAWTVVWNPEYVIGFWCGHKRGGFGDERLVGAKASAPNAWRIARSLYSRDEGPWYVKPLAVKERTVCTESGCPAGPVCPEIETGRYIDGRSSWELCRKHRIGANGKLVERKTSAFEISRPENGATYHLPENGDEVEMVCRIKGGGDNERVWWFVDGSPSDETDAKTPFTVKLKAGAHSLTCATMDGKISTVSVTVAR